MISQKKIIENVIKEEELSFLRTLDQGLILLDELVKTSTDSVISRKIYYCVDADLYLNPCIKYCINIYVVINCKSIFRIYHK
jgi:hypothetical protein